MPWAFSIKPLRTTIRRALRQRSDPYQETSSKPLMSNSRTRKESSQVRKACRGGPGCDTYSTLRVGTRGTKQKRCPVSARQLKSAAIRKRTRKSHSLRKLLPTRPLTLSNLQKNSNEGVAKMRGMSLKLFDLSGRVAVVMGGTSGIGRTLAVGLAEAGADVVATGRRENLVHEVAADLEKLGRKTLRRTTDASSRESIDAFRDLVLDSFGRVDIVLNAAGQIFRKATISISEPEWNRLMDVNLTGALRTCQSFYGALVNSGRGRVINIVSLTSYVSFFEVAAYAASK